jgi:hypothetical protein
VVGRRRRRRRRMERMVVVGKMTGRMRDRCTQRRVTATARGRRPRLCADERSGRGHRRTGLGDRPSIRCR